MRGCPIGAVGQVNIEIRAIFIVLACLGECEAIEGDVELTEQLVETIYGHGRVVRSVHIIPRTADQFTPEVEFIARCIRYRYRQL